MKIINSITLFLCLVLVVFSSCKKDTPTPTSTELDLPEISYNYAALDIPADVQHQDNTPNNNTLNDEGATLGRVLFYDKKLSLNNAIACASCHDQSKAFCDPAQFSTGFLGEKTSRNSPPLFNMRYASSFFWDSEATILEDQVLMPIKDHIEMGMESLDDLETKLKAVDYYPALFEKAFGSEEITGQRISKAMAQFIRSMTSFNSKYDEGLQNNFANFSSLESMGKDLFFSWKSSCGSCHGNSTFTNGEATNIGLDVSYTDNGVGALTGQSRMDGAFKVPSLRNIELTAPYMHDGRFETLEEVVEHYSSGVQNHPNTDWRIRGGKNFTDIEKQALVAFLKTLTDHNFTQDPKFSSPFR